ncbi:MAG: DUF2461 domain-containing protein [bacterium]
MRQEISFGGFPRECVKFFIQLAQNNNKAWFEAHREEYENFVMQPAQEFVMAMGKRLQKLSPKVNADPRVNRSLFRLNRDVRFSKDKRPYKTNFAAMFWEGNGARMECSCYYFHLEPPNLMLGVGIYMFTPEMLEVYRRACVHPRHGTALAKAVKQLLSNKGFNLGGSFYKRVSRDYDPEHPNAALLLHNGLHAGIENKIPKEFYSAKLLDYCYARYQEMAPLHKWLVKVMER